MADLRTVLRIIARDETKGQLSKVRGELRGVSNTLTVIRNQALALAGVNLGLGGLAQLTAVADGYQLTTSRLEILSGETDRFAEIQGKVFQIGQDTYTAYDQVAQIYGNLAASTREIGLESEQLLTITKALTQSYQISGSTQQEARASTIQLTQALASGQIRGQEFNSVAEQGRRILFALKDATGLTAGELREFANQGKLTTEFFVKNFLPQAEAINEEFARTPLTVGRSLTQLNNAFEKFVGETNKSLGITRDIATVIQDVATNFDQFATVIITSGGLLVSFLTQRFVASMSLAAGAKLKDVQASLAASKAAQGVAASKLQEAKATATSAAAHEASIAAKIADERATRALMLTQGIYGAQLQAVSARIGALTAQQTAAAAATAAANTAVATANAAVTASTLRMTLAMRAWQSTLLFLGGPIGAAVTGIAALGAAIVYFSDNADTGDDLFDDFRDGVNKIKDDADAAATSLDGIADAMIRVKFASKFEQLAQGERAIQKLASELAKLESDFFEETGGAQPNDPRVAYIEKRRQAYIEAKKEVENFREELKKQIQDEQELAAELTGRDGQVTGVPKKLKDALDEQDKANEKIKNIEKARRKLIDDLDALSEQLSGPQLGNIEEQTASFNVASLNTLRGQIQGDVDDNDAEAALRKLERARDIVEQLRESGGASDSYLKSQVDLLNELAEKTGDIDLPGPDGAVAEVAVTPKIDDTALLEEGKRVAEAYNENIAPLFPFLAPLEFDPETASQSIATWRQQEQEKLNQNPLTALIRIATPADQTEKPATPGFAYGGRVRGPGTGTSDSIPAWLSNDEFIVRERAAKFYGYDFLNKLNSMRLPKFAQGGRVGGGSATRSGTPIIFNMDGQQVEVAASGAGVNDLKRLIRRENMRRGQRV